MMKRLNQQAGFTLIEMLIVLLIISILIIQIKNN
ncbi:prepilin-type N-terminal cleavage/methylation domain-containing protein [Lysinibacillus capsici]